MKRTPFAPRRGPVRARSRRTSDIPPEIRQEVRLRAHGLCEVCHDVHRGVHAHHRRMRSQGGQHTVANLLWVCMEVHGDIHANPQRSYALGHLVPGWASPENVPFERLPQ